MRSDRIPSAILGAFLPFAREREKSLQRELEKATRGELPAGRAEEVYEASCWGWLSVSAIAALVCAPFIFLAMGVDSTAVLWIARLVMIGASSLACGKSLLAYFDHSRAVRQCARGRWEDPYVPIKAQGWWVLLFSACATLAISLL
jgi:hypothetical protein